MPKTSQKKLTKKLLDSLKPLEAKDYSIWDCQRRSKNLPDGGVKEGHCSWRHFAVAGGVKVV